MNPKQVLLVEDNALNAKLVVFLLEAAGHEVKVATHAKEALTMLTGRLPDLILMDLQLPEVSGYDLTRQLRSAPATANLLIVALTAFAMTGDEAKALEAGCDAYVTKPVDAKTFVARVEGMMERGREGVEG